MSPWLPRTLKARALWILCGLILVSHTVSLFIFEASREQAVVSTEARDLADRIAGIVDLSRTFPAADRQQILSAAQTQFLATFPASGNLQAVACQDNNFSRSLSEIIDAEFERMPGLEADVCVRDLSSAVLPPRGNLRGFDVLVSIDFSDGMETVFHAVLPAARPLFQDDVLIYLLAAALIAVALAWFLIRKAVNPLQHLAVAADQLGVNIDAPKLAKDGPWEVASAARAFNRMQDRLARLVHGQTEMLAAISHDLRSALTRLQLRVELLQESAEKDSLLRVLKDMRIMVESVLAFSRGASAEEAPQMADLNKLVAGLCRDREEEGTPVQCDIGTGPRMLLCRPASLRRAILNLVDNAVKYGGSARLALLNGERHFIIRVTDEGPGIPADKMEAVFNPFYRLEESRSQETGGLGLGLAIARNIAQAHGGDVRIGNRQNGGLQADLVLPVTKG